jgi:[acyl-carrier-protein] S-malonyltransferase
MSLALVFPGQGAQYVGMGLDFYEHNERANAIFAAADFHLKNFLQPGLKDVMFTGPEEHHIF